MARILVTGFEPFGHHLRNISSELIEHLPSTLRFEDPWSDLRQHTESPLTVSIDKRVLSVDLAGSTEISSALHQGQHWDAILHIGLCDSCQIPRLETLAQDRIDMRIPDNSGRQTRSESLTGTGDFSVSIPVESWMHLGWSTECELSNDAGTFLCNETFYRTLSALEATSNSADRQIPCLFLHLPSSEKCSISTGMKLVQEILHRMMYRPVLSVVAALISKNDHYLIARRSVTESHSGKWEFPGGKVEPNESLIQALEREIMEEFSWKVICEKSIGTWYHSLIDIDIALHVLPTNYDGQIPDLEDKELWSAHDEVSWRPLADTSIVDWLGNDEAVVDWMRKTAYLPKAK